MSHGFIAIIHRYNKGAYQANLSQQRTKVENRKEGKKKEKIDGRERERKRKRERERVEEGEQRQTIIRARALFKQTDTQLTPTTPACRAKEHCKTSRYK